MTKAPGFFATLRSRPNVQLSDLTSEEQKREPLRHPRIRLELPSEVPWPRAAGTVSLSGKLPPAPAPA
jgi:hypothetical protein